MALQTFGEHFRTVAEDQGISLELVRRVTTLASGGLDFLPHNGAVITLPAVYGMTHRPSCKDIGMVSVVIPVAALIVVVVLGTLFGALRSPLQSAAPAEGAPTPGAPSAVIGTPAVK